MKSHREKANDDFRVLSADEARAVSGGSGDAGPGSGTGHEKNNGGKSGSQTGPGTGGGKDGGIDKG
jgi:hypothetical protein